MGYEMERPHEHGMYHANQELSDGHELRFSRRGLRQRTNPYLQSDRHLLHRPVLR